jgi:hypothetical protein
MRLVAAGDTYVDMHQTLNYLSAINEGIVVLAEGSLDRQDKQWESLDPIVALSPFVHMTIVGEAQGQIQQINRGYIKRFQVAHADHPDAFALQDRARNLSYNCQEVRGLTRICADCFIPHKANIDLLTISSAHDFINDVEEIAQQFRFNNNAHIIQSHAHEGPSFIYSVQQQQMVGHQVKTPFGTYLVHEY